jgi:hypothetical protein
MLQRREQAPKCGSNEEGKKMATGYISRQSCTALPFKNHFKEIIQQVASYKTFSCKKKAYIPEMYLTLTVFRVQNYQTITVAAWPKA